MPPASPNVEPWQVYYVTNCVHTKPHPKNKFVMIACIDEYPMGFLINSRINLYVQNRPNLLVCQALISRSRHSFLHHDSYIDCRDIFDFPNSWLDNYMGSIDKLERERVLESVRLCKVLPAYYKKLILQNS